MFISITALTLWPVLNGSENISVSLYVSMFLYFIIWLHEQIEQKQKYAIWKAADIRKALKEGRKPEAGPPGGDKDEAPGSTTTISQVIS